MTKRIVVSSDHAGFDLKEKLKGFLEELGYQVEDVGTYSTKPVDYPEYTLKAAQKVASGEHSRGIIFCGTGQGDAVAANKVSGIRAALCWNILTAQLSRAHNNANILVLGGWLLGERLTREIVSIWLATPFDGGRHQRRLQQIEAIEASSNLRRGKVYDVSLPIYPGMPVWPGDPAMSTDYFKSTGRGDSSNVSLLHMGSHSGTHVDAPSHFIPDAPGIDSTEPDILMGPARLIHLPEAHHISRRLLEGQDLAGVSRLLLATRNSALLKQNPPSMDYTFVTEDAASYLVDIGVKLVGIDYLSIEEAKKEGHPVHHTLLSGGVVIIEGLDLTGVPAADYELLCLPLKLKGGDAAPARVFLREVL
jgi:arylformamidase